MVLILFFFYTCNVYMYNHLYCVPLCALSNQRQQLWPLQCTSNPVYVHVPRWGSGLVDAPKCIHDDLSNLNTALASLLEAAATKRSRPTPGACHPC